MKTQASRGYNIPDPNPGWSSKAGDQLVEVFDMRGDGKLTARVSKDGRILREDLIERSMVTPDSRDFSEFEAKAIIDFMAQPKPKTKAKMIEEAMERGGQAPNPMVVPAPIR
jgi:hypothetical protein